jgi:hypothetical protein
MVLVILWQYVLAVLAGPRGLGLIPQWVLQ